MAWNRIRNKDGGDPTVFNDGRVLQNLLSTENRCLPSVEAFLQTQKQITLANRAVLTSWMLEVCTELQRRTDMFPLAVNYMDRVLCAVNFKRGNLQLLGTASMLLASKMSDLSIPLDVRLLVLYTDCSVNMHQVVTMELQILNILRWDISVVTPHTFIDHILTRLPVNEHRLGILKTHAHDISARTSVVDIQCFQSSTIAAASLCLAAEIQLGWDNELLIDKLNGLPLLDMDKLSECLHYTRQTVAIASTVKYGHGH